MNGTTNDSWATLEEPSTRTPRSLDTRDRAERERVWSPPQILPDPIPQDGWVFKWVRSIYDNNRDDKRNYQKRLREGWEPVRAEDHPEMLTDIGVEQKTGIVEVGGLVLCKLPAEMRDQRNRYYQKRTTDVLEAAEDNYMRDSDERMKKVFEKRRKVVFGQ